MRERRLRGTKRREWPNATERPDPTLEPPVAQHRPCRPIGNYKIVDTSSAHTQHMGMSSGHHSNNRCNVQEAFPPSESAWFPYRSVATTTAKVKAMTGRNGPSNTLPQVVGRPSSRPEALPGSDRVDQPAQQLGAAHPGVQQQVLGVRVRAAAVGAEPVEGRDPQRRGEIPVAAAP